MVSSKWVCAATLLSVTPSSSVYFDFDERKVALTNPESGASRVLGLGRWFGFGRHFLPLEIAGATAAFLNFIGLHAHSSLYFAETIRFCSARL